MRVAIDMDKMRVIHVHRVQEILHGLVFLEANNVKSVLFDDTERTGFLSTLTTLELTLLLRNLTGQEFPPQYDDLARREAISEAVGKLKARLVDERELELQIEAVRDRLELPVGKAPQFRYVLGAKVPKIEDGGLEALAAPKLADATFAAAVQQAPQRRTAPAAPTPAATPAPRPAPAQRAPRPAGGVRPVVWAHADAAWEAAGKPRDSATVLALRKKWMSELEEKGIKKTSSSTSLGEWQKERIG